MVEAQRFWDWIVEKVKAENEIQDWNRAIKMPKAYIFQTDQN